MTIVIPRDQADFDRLLHLALSSDHPDKRITLRTDTPYTSLDIPEGLAVAIGALPDPALSDADADGGGDEGADAKTDGGAGDDGETSAAAPAQDAPGAADGDTAARAGTDRAGRTKPTGKPSKSAPTGADTGEETR